MGREEQREHIQLSAVACQFVFFSFIFSFTRNMHVCFLGSIAWLILLLNKGVTDDPTPKKILLEKSLWHHNIHVN